MKKLLPPLFFAAGIALLSGCTSTSVVKEFDDKGNLVKETTTNESVIDQIVKSTKDKTVYVWSKGWAAYISGSTATTDDPTPTFKIYAGQIDRGVLSLHKDLQNYEGLATVIKACNSSAISVSSEGVSSSSGGK